MPHTVPVGLQALILCGPGGSLNTFTSRPEEFPKALIQVANRPMVFYAIDLCRDSDITGRSKLSIAFLDRHTTTYQLEQSDTVLDITLITPPLCYPPLRQAMDSNPYLTSASLPSVSIIAPKHLKMTMGTAELLRLPEVQRCIKTNFLLLPCDIICELSGESILEAWLTTQGVLKAVLDNPNPGGTRNGDQPTGSYFERKKSERAKAEREKKERRGALAVYYQTDNREESVPEEATDFVAIGPLELDDTRTVPPREDAAKPRFNMSKLLMSMPMATIKEKMKDEKRLLLRRSLVQRCGRVRVLTAFRDAHIYIFPFWVKDLLEYQTKLDSVSEDFIGNWAKSAWQEGLGDKMGLTKDFDPPEIPTAGTPQPGGFVDKVIDLRRMSSTKSCRKAEIPVFRTCFKSADSSFSSQNSTAQTAQTQPPTELPQLLAYVHRGSKPFIRRVDSSAILLSTSLFLAKLPSIEEVGPEAASSFAHAKKITHPDNIAPRSAVTTKDCLLDRNVIVEAAAVIKESVIGAECHIGSGARIHRCVLMDGVVVESRAELTGCVIGHRARIGRGCVLRNCEVQDAHVIPKGTISRDERLMVDVAMGD
jgi:translation initiation factor eIF-2B subunit gamma